MSERVAFGLPIDASCRAAPLDVTGDLRG